MELKFKCLVFDLDGTLFDTMGVLNQLAQDVLLKHYGLAKNFGSELYKKTSGLPFRYQLEAIFPGHSLNDAASAAFEEEKVRLYQKPVRVFDEVWEHMALWKKWGYKLAVSSNDEESNVKTKLGQNQSVFDAILGHKPGFLKGQPHFDFILNAFNLKPSELLFVGDSLHDAKMAHENGLSFVGRLGTFSKEEFLNLKMPCYLVHDFFEMHGFLQHHS